MDRIINEANINLIESIKNISQNTPKGHVIETSDYILATIGVNTTESHANAVFSLNDNSFEKIFKETNSFFKENNMDYIFWIVEGKDRNMERYLKNLGYKPSREPGTALMVTDNKLTDISLKKGMEVIKVESQRNIDDFIYLIYECFDLDYPVAKAMFDNPQVLNSEKNSAYLIYEENKPVSAVQIYKTGNIAGIYWVATLESMRGKGLGKYISTFATNKAFDIGAKKVILQASKLGQYVYDRIGYDVIGYYRTYKIENK